MLRFVFPYININCNAGAVAVEIPLALVLLLGRLRTSSSVGSKDVLTVPQRMNVSTINLIFSGGACQGYRLCPVSAW